MRIENIQKLTTDLYELLTEYERLKDLESRSFDLQLTEKQQETIKMIVRTGHRSSMTGKHCGGCFHIMLYLSHEGTIHKETKPVIYCTYCGEVIEIGR